MPSNLDSSSRRYVEHDLLSRNPQELVLAAYDLGLKGCRKQDRSLVRDVLTELIAALDFNQPVAGNFLVLYDYALREVRENRFEQPERILSCLRDAWKQAMEESRHAALTGKEAGMSTAA
ncbi:MAG: flagellar protein FliS [Candidatus Eisenbacteria bacterium]|nr:flagellar protein FliS [Candidatus Eisenbacteria bacterium]